MEYFIIGMVVFIGAITYTVWNDLQNVDKNMWTNKNEMRDHIRKLEADIIELNRFIRELKDKIEEKEEETSQFFSSTLFQTPLLSHREELHPIQQTKVF